MIFISSYSPLEDLQEAANTDRMRMRSGVDQDPARAAGRELVGDDRPGLDFRLVDSPPAVAAELFHRPEAGLVGHSVRAIDPIAEIDIRQAGARGADDVVEDDVGAQATS